MDNRLKARANTVRAITVAGGHARLAQALDGHGIKITPAAIHQWDMIPVARARAVSEITGIPLHSLRPDIWDAPPSAPPAPSPEA